MSGERPLRVLFLDHTAKLAGGEIALVNLLGALDREVIEPKVTLFEEGPLVGRLRAMGVKVDVLPLAKQIEDSHGACGHSVTDQIAQLAVQQQQPDCSLPWFYK